MSEKLFRVALIGPESTGKTTLCMQLANHFHSEWVPEFARTYLEQLDRPYDLDDVLFCAQSQLLLENKIQQTAQNILFCDTEMINFKIWLEDKYAMCPEWIEKTIEENNYDLFLLTFPDLPFEEDPLRENPERRDYFYNLYKEELEKRNFPYEIIRGSDNHRFEMAVASINKHYKI
jgi:NadR type nicotinamide-nucleotide adenylyltransferase